MASTINASTTSTTGLVYTADGTGILQLQSDGTTGLTVGAGGKIILANTALSTASAGTLEYDGGELYFTPLSTQRGLIPNMQFYRLDSALVGSNVNTAQSILGVGVTLSSSTIYEFSALYALSKTAGATSHTVGFGFGGTATVNNISWGSTGTWYGAQSSPAGYGSAGTVAFAVSTSNTTATAALANANTSLFALMKGTVSINSGGTFIPQYTLSVAPGGAYSTLIGSYFSIWPVGAAGSNTNIGTWA